MAEIEELMGLMERIRSSLERSREETEEASTNAASLGGEWEQETSRDLDGIAVRIRDIVSDLDDIIDEAKTMRDDSGVMEEIMEEITDDEEMDKIESEPLKDEVDIHIKEEEEKHPERE